MYRYQCTSKGIDTSHSNCMSLIVRNAYIDITAYTSSIQDVRFEQNTLRLLPKTYCS